MIINPDGIIENVIVKSTMDQYPAPDGYIVIEGNGPIGATYANGQVVVSEKVIGIDEAWSILRQDRDILLAKSDWTQVADAPVNSLAWANYRQALRDLPANTTDPYNPIWPTPPA